eukprot:652752-Pelagomonas_calceolata.AAC.1
MARAVPYMELKVVNGGSSGGGVVAVTNGIGEEKEEEDDDDDEGDSDDVLLTTVVRLGIVVQSVTVVATAVAMITGNVCAVRTARDAVLKFLRHTNSARYNESWLDAPSVSAPTVGSFFNAGLYISAL